MDRTLKPVKRGDRRRKARNWNAWQLLSPDGAHCRFCPHTAADHLCSSKQPHFYRLATEEEMQDPSSGKLYHHETPEGVTILVKRVIVAKQAELITAFCKACAEELQTGQVMCYQRTLANGEVIGIRNARQGETT